MTARKKSSSDANDIAKKVVGKTKGKKKLIIDQTRVGMYFIKFEDGGQLPKKLKGSYTRYEFAERAIMLYLAEK